MNSGELTRIQLANRLVCASQQISIGPTGPTGSPGAYVTIPGAMKAFTMYLDYSATNALSRIYIPPGLFSTSAFTGLAQGGTFNTNQGSDLAFDGLDTISLYNTQYAFCTGISASGYINGGEWNPVAGGNIGPTKIFYTQTDDKSLIIKGLNLGNINGANTAVKSPAGRVVPQGFLATITLFYV